jgi:raffinose/stachyose/melibiose transport system permease protein
MNKKFSFGNIVKYIFLIIGAFIVVYPIFTVLMGSLKNNSDIMLDPFGLPHHPIFANYIDAWTDGPLGSLFKNSIIVTFSSVFLVVVFSSMIAFVMTRKDFKKIGNIIFIVIVVGITIPAQVGILPLYLQLSRFNLIDTYAGLIITYIVYYMPFTIFIMQGFFKDVPDEIQDAALIDGCGNFRLYLSIIMPLSRSVVTAVTILNFMFIWNEMFFALVLIRRPILKTLTIGLFAFKGQYNNNYASMFAGIIIVSIPMILLFLVLQKRFLEGVSAGALKG